MKLRNTPEPFKLHIVYQEVSGLHQLVDLLQQFFLLLSVLVGLVLICSTGEFVAQLLYRTCANVEDGRC